MTFSPTSPFGYGASSVAFPTATGNFVLIQACTGHDASSAFRTHVDRYAKMDIPIFAIVDMNFQHYADQAVSLATLRVLKERDPHIQGLLSALTIKPGYFAHIDALVLRMNASCRYATDVWVRELSSAVIETMSTMMKAGRLPSVPIVLMTGASFIRQYPNVGIDAIVEKYNLPFGVIGNSEGLLEVGPEFRPGWINNDYNRRVLYMVASDQTAPKYLWSGSVKSLYKFIGWDAGDATVPTIPTETTPALTYTSDLVMAIQGLTSAINALNAKS